MKKRLMAAVLSTAMAATMLLTGSISVQAADAAAANDPAVELIFTSVSVSGDSHTEAMYEFADKVEELSGGSVTCKCYDNGSLFSSENEFDALLNGDADLAYISFPTIATQIPSYSMFASGYLFSSYEHMTSVLNGDIGLNKIRPQIEETLNIKPLSSFYLGSRVINTREKEINSYDDMNGLLLRMPNSEAWLFLGEALGANPTPLSFSELYTALQTGAVDGQENPLFTIYNSRFYEVQKYLSLTEHFYPVCPLMMSEITWNKLSPEQQDIVADAMKKSVDYERELAGEELDKMLEGCKEKGMEVNEVDKAPFIEAVQPVYEKYNSQFGSLIEKINAAK